PIYTLSLHDALPIFGISCADSPDSKRVTKIIAPDQLAFETFVSPFLERKCATLDCHGQVGRPLRLYSGRGLRLPADGGVFPGSRDRKSTRLNSSHDQ